MIRLFVRHPVADFGPWKKAYDDFKDEARSMGCVGEAVHQAVDDPNDVTVTNDFETLDAAKAFIGSPRLKEAMTAAGLAGEPQIWLTNLV